MSAVATQLDIDVLGMHCGACVRRIETAVRKHRRAKMPTPRSNDAASGT